ncbi:MAG: RidA family protein [Lachnospiraceae bacterium]|jgi:enamine deaminase RidA (YjgF/YER057c/UK114 family)
METEKRIEELGIELPDSSPPKAMYIPVKKTGNIIFVSGQIPAVDGEIVNPGRVGESVTEEQASESARICAVNIIAALKSELGDLDQVKNIVKIQGFVNSAPSFDRQHLVVNAASQLLFDVFGEKGRHARTVVGVAALPLNAPVEIEAIVEVL